MTDAPEGGDVGDDIGATAGDSAPSGAEPTSPGQVSRRLLFGAAGLGAVAVGAAAGAAAATRNDETTVDASSAAAGSVPFRGVHQAGITTPAQDRLHFAAFDVLTDDRDELIDLLREWTAAAARMTEGRTAEAKGAMDGPLDAPPTDTGEAYDLPPSQLTVTIGFGPGLFTKDGVDRFGIADRRPAALVDLPHFPADRLDEARTGGDLCVQACANDPQVAVHAVRNLARIGFGKVSVRWSQLGFGRTSSTSTAQDTPRNLFGFKDGTANLKAEEPDLVDEFVWVADDDEAAPGRWMAGGSYLVARRINMHIETWDRTSLREQEMIMGRDKREGAPLSGGTEFTPLDLTAKDEDGEPVIAVASHVRLAHPDENDGNQILRRGYNFTDGTDGLGRLDAGLFFIAFVRDPRTQYVPLQNKMSRDDLLMEYLIHTGSGIFAVPPGLPSSGGYIGEPLFADA